MEHLLERFFTWLSTITQHDVVAWTSFLSIFIIFISFSAIVRRTHNEKIVNWADIVTAKGTNNVSLTKVIQLVGGIVSSWIVIKMTLQEKLTWDIFSIYLAYTASVEGYSKFLSAKYNLQNAMLANQTKDKKDVKSN
jgi:hypothetical protein